MGIRRGSISTPIIADGLILNMDAANRASYVPNVPDCLNTADLTQSGSFVNSPGYITQPISSSCWEFDGCDCYIDISDSDSMNIPNNITLLFAVANIAIPAPDPKTMLSESKVNE